MAIGFVVWNPFQVFHMKPVADRLDDSVFIVVNKNGLESLRSDFGGSVSTFVDGPHQIVTPRQLLDLDGVLDALVCPNPFPGMNSFVSTRRVGMQYSMTKESYQYGVWRSQFDINLAYGEYSVKKLLPFGPAVAVGNPRFQSWFAPGGVGASAGASRAAEASVARRRTVLYLPTWGEFSSVPTFLSAIDELQDDYDVIAKLHHKIYLTEPDKAGSLFASGIRNAFLSHDDLIPLLEQADLVVSDYSGAIFDAIYVRKPVLLLQEDPGSLVGGKFTFDSIEYARRGEIGPVVSSPGELRGAINAILGGSVDYRDANEQLRSECFSEDADSADRCAEVLRASSQHRRNPLSPHIRSVAGVARRSRPVDAQLSRLAQESEERRPRLLARRSASAQRWSPSRRLVKSLARATRAHHVVAGGVAMVPGTFAPLIRKRLLGLGLRLSDDPGWAARVLVRALSRRSATVTERLWLADLLFVSQRGERAAAVIDDLSTNDLFDHDLLVLLARVYRSTPAPAATWSATRGLSSPAPHPAAEGERVLSSSDSPAEVLQATASNAASIVMSRGEYDLAADLYTKLLCLDDDVPELHYRCGLAHESTFRFEEAMQAFSQAVTRSPFTVRYRRAAVRVCSKTEKWQEARRFSRHTHRDQPLQVSRRLGSGREQEADLEQFDRAFTDPSVVGDPQFREVVDRGLQVATLRPPDYWIALHWRLLALGCYSDAYRIKDLAASSIVDDLSQGDRINAASTILLARALITLGRSDEARQLLLANRRGESDADWRLNLMKVAADAAFFEGEIDPLLEWQAERRVDVFPQKHAREAAREIFRDKRVVIVGPGRTTTAGGDSQIDGCGSHDVVVRPNLLFTTGGDPEFGPQGTDVVYFNSGITRLGLAGLLKTSAEQGVRQAVLRRPRDLSLLAPMLEAGDVRLIDVEPGCHLFASCFGIQRFIYDISLYSPRSICVVNVDFFTGSVEYADGYKVENADVSFRGYSHDYRGDFKLSQHLLDSGAVQFDATATTILSSSVEEYLDMLDRT